MTTVTAEMLRRGRDLTDQNDALKAEKDGIVFMETSPRETPIIVYSMSDGEPIPMSPRIAEMAMKKRYKGGGYLFTDRKEEAPEYVRGEVKCFLHPQSPERLSGQLQEAGIAHFSCNSANHQSRFAMREVAKTKHRKQWEALQDYIKETEAEADRQERRQQLEATLALAGRATTAVVTEPVADPAADDQSTETVAAAKTTAKRGAANGTE